MSYLALARRYRPGDFENILSQHHVTTTLKNAVKSGRISHSYLFCGPRGTGKTTTARVLAKALNCEKGPTPEPCGQCNVCKEITMGSSPDVFEIDAASNRGIDDIRDLRENVRYAPVGGKYKIYIIDEVHRLTKEAFDALLKTLEEPPSHVIFIFATTEPQSLPATILSRTQRYDFKRIPITALAEAVNSVALKEGLVIDPNAALLIAKKADGSFRDALSLLDQLSSFSEKRIDADLAAEILGLVKTELLQNISQNIINHDVKLTLGLFAEYSNSGGDSQELAEALSGYFRSLLLIKNGVDDVEILALDKSEIDSGKNLLGDIDTVDLLRYFTAFADYKGMVRQGQDPDYSFEMTLVKACSMDRAVALDAILKKMPSSPTSVSQASNAKPAPAKSFSVPRKETPPAAEYLSDGSVPEMPDNFNSSIPQEINAPSNSGSITDQWKDLCQFIFKRSKPLYALFMIGKPVKLEDGILTVKFESDYNYQYEQLSLPDKRQTLEESLKAFFGAPTKVNLIKGTASNQNNVNKKSATDSNNIFEGAPAAKKLFDLLGGEITGQ